MVKVGMTIDTAINVLGMIEAHGVCIEAKDIAVDTMCKYQRIQEIIKDWEDGRFSDAVGCLRVKMAVEDGNDLGVDCISRQATINAVKRIHPVDTDYDCTLLDKDDVMYVLDEMPSVTPIRPKGNWMTKPHVYGVTYCSKCDFELKIDNTNYCPNCGCKMVESQESEDKG